MSGNIQTNQTWMRDMAEPTQYDKDYDFSAFQSTKPDEPLPGDRLDTELQNIETAIDETQGALQDIRRSDGQLQNGIVTPDSISDLAYVVLGVAVTPNEDVIAVAENIDAVTSVADDIADVVSVADNMAAVLAAEGNAELARKFAVNPEDTEVDPSTYPGEYSAFHYSKKAESSAAAMKIVRNAANAAALSAALADGEVGFMNGLPYRKDATATGADSATDDLGVDGLVPEGTTVYPAHFGTGAAAVAKALNFSGASIVDLSGVPAVLMSGIVVDRGGVTIKGLDLSGEIPDDGVSLDFSGVIGSSVSLTVDAAIGANTITVGGATHPFEVDKFARLRSDAALWYKNFATLEVGGTIGEMVRVRQVTGSAGAWVVEFYDNLEFPYAVADNARAEPIDMLENITLESPKLSGSILTDDQLGLRFFACDKVRVINPRTTDCDFSHIVFDACGDCAVIGGGAIRTGEEEGLDYDITGTNCTYSLRVIGYEGVEARHGVTVGGSIGAVRYYHVADSRFLDAIDGGADAHPGSINAVFENNDIVCRNGGQDGLIGQGLRFAAINNRISGALTRHGILYQPTISVAGVKGAFKARGNDIRSSVGASSGIIASLEENKTAVVSDVDIGENTVENATTGIRAIVGTGATLNDFRVQANTMRDVGSRGVHCTVSGGTLDRWLLGGNTSDGTDEVYYMQEASGSLGLGRLVSNHAEDATTAYRVSGAEGFTTDGANTQKNCTNFWALSGNGYQNINELVHGSKTVDPVSLAAGARHTETVSVSGASVGDIVVGASHSVSLLNDVLIEIEGVVGTGTVRVHYFNRGATARDVAEGTLRVAVRKVT